ncbi:MAG: CDP-diacylglycerol--serine O-phosphatidyltransferase [Syntrophobacteraceae bacterium]
MSNEVIKKRRPRRKRWRREGEVHRGTYIFPNLFTTANLFSGFFGIVNSINGNFEMAALAIFASGVFDILDGQVARLTGGTSRFGIEYDSLADLVAFGVAPGLLMYLMALQPYGRVGWLAAFVFMACGALRLARFNVQVGTTSKKYFVGLPIPGGAGMIATTVLFLSYYNIEITTSFTGPVLLVLTYLLGSFMISTMPFNSFKDFAFIKAKPSFVVFGVIVMVSVIAVKPQLMLFLCGAIYTVSGPVRWVAWRIQGKKGFQEGIPAVPPAPTSEEAAPGQTLSPQSDQPVQKAEDQR